MMRQAFTLAILLTVIGLSSQSKRKTCSNLYADDCTNLPCCTPGPFGQISCYAVDQGRRCFYDASVVTTTDSPRCFLRRCNGRSDCCDRNRACLFYIPRIVRGYCF
ncbi:hypothetical protein RRG08_004063 [Elysia crispata]|uniref:Uncharacterized protein n=1 Tax=Elysia crispata TaxID=231223 RepID=A0AAE1AH34_9GAST|nr:hypothetical protein RRG08_004063 [Elysia crispata]